MLSDTAICNMALSHLGVGQSIANLETEKSQEAEACRVFFDVTRDAILRDFKWPHATKIQALELIEEDPNDEWAYSYSVPTNCLSFKRILSGERNDTRQSRVPYRMVQDASRFVIFTDQEDAIGEWVYLNEDFSHSPADFALAFSFRLAAYIAPRLTAGDPYKLGDRAMRLYQFEVGKAQSNAANEEQVEQEPQSEFIRERET